MDRQCKLLVVDDDRLVLATLTHGLAQAGYDILSADNGDDAILLARQHRPDLALLDIRMEGKSGFDVAQYLRDVTHTPFMFLSAFSDDATIAQVNALGAVAYLVKPLEISQILPAIDKALLMVQHQRQSSLVTAPGDLMVPKITLDPAGIYDQVVPMAVGIFMHRHSIPRRQAYEQLQRLAIHEVTSIEATAAKVVEATEQLSLPFAPLSGSGPY